MQFPFLMPFLHVLGGTDHDPILRAVQKLADHLRIQIVSGLVSDNVANNRHPDERQVTECISWFFIDYQIEV